MERENPHQEVPLFRRGLVLWLEHSCTGTAQLETLSPNRAPTPLDLALPGGCQNQWSCARGTLSGPILWKGWDNMATHALCAKRSPLLGLGALGSALPGTGDRSIPAPSAASLRNCPSPGLSHGGKGLEDWAINWCRGIWDGTKALGLQSTTRSGRG